MSEKIEPKYASVGDLPVALDWGTVPPAVFADVVVVAKHAEVFCVIYGEVAPPVPVAELEGQKHIMATVVASVRVPPRAMSEFVRHTVAKWNDYVEGLGTEERDRSGFKTYGYKKEAE